MECLVGGSIWIIFPLAKSDVILLSITSGWIKTEGRFLESIKASGP